MRKISLKNLNLKEVEQLSREQLKNVLGGISGSGGDDDGNKGRCIECTVTKGPNQGASSCWYSTASTPNDLCSRVYPDPEDTGVGAPVECHSGCTMN